MTSEIKTNDSTELNAVQSKQVATPAEIIRSEANFLQFPFFALGTKGLKSHSGITVELTKRIDDESHHISVRISGNDDYGHPGPLSRKIHHALIAKLQREHKFPPFRNPICWRWAELSRLVGKNTCGGHCREARKILRECQQRLLNGEYAASGGAITASHASPTIYPTPHVKSSESVGKSWQECYEKYRKHKKARIRGRSLDDAISRINIAERIFEKHRQKIGLPEGLPVREVMTLEILEYLQDRLLEGDESQSDRRSINTVNGMMGAIMAFVRFCDSRNWIDQTPALQKIKTDEVMKGRPITTEEFERMLDATPDVVGSSSAVSWHFALKILWESGFRIADLMDFHWDDERHIQPFFPTSEDMHPTIVIPSTQKNGRVQEIPMLPGLQELLRSVPTQAQTGWIANPEPVEYRINDQIEWFQPLMEDLESLANRFSNCSIASACQVSETTVRKWLKKFGIQRDREFKHDTGFISTREIKAIRNRASSETSRIAQRSAKRLTTKHVGRVIARIGKAAGIVVQPETKTKKVKFASAHDLRRGCALRLINAGVSAETLKIIMRHKNFATTEKHYGAFRSAQSAAKEVADKLSNAQSTPLVGGLMGGIEKAPQLSAEELLKLKSLLNSL